MKDFWKLLGGLCLRSPRIPRSRRSTSRRQLLYSCGMGVSKVLLVAALRSGTGIFGISESPAPWSFDEVPRHLHCSISARYRHFAPSEHSKWLFLHGRAVLRMGFFIGSILWPRLKSMFSIHVQSLRLTRSLSAAYPKLQIFFVYGLYDLFVASQILPYTPCVVGV